MRKFAVVESRVCGAGVGFRLAGEGFWVGVDAVLGRRVDAVFVLEMLELWCWKCRSFSVGDEGFVPLSWSFR